MNTKYKNSRPGFLLLETMVTIALIILLMGMLAWSLTEYSRHTESVRTRMRAVAAAESVLNEIRAGVSEDVAAFSERFRGLAMNVKRSPGEGDWRGLTLVVVRVSEVRTDEAARPLAELSGYVPEATP